MKRALIHPAISLFVEAPHVIHYVRAVEARGNGVGRQESLPSYSSALWDRRYHIKRPLNDLHCGFRCFGMKFGLIPIYIGCPLNSFGGLKEVFKIPILGGLRFAVAVPLPPYSTSIGDSKDLRTNNNIARVPNR